MHDFSKEPPTIGQLRAKRSDNAKDWTPRDCLLEVLAKLDGGEIAPEGLVVCFYEKAGEDGITDVRFSNACPNVIMATGLLHRSLHLLGMPNEER
jgi:hypothetical protein